ncbi:ensconsin-like isoform X2 [Thrips palmi]|uniref:Ensconsin-like isoform X2 n=1 Tax=Thrips palmi TaxID=161013 RepID=A0A6P9A7I3_THRPL|nr:ensconsin-like isoform X2 [Thrips palmi]
MLTAARATAGPPGLTSTSSSGVARRDQPRDVHDYDQGIDHVDLDHLFLLPVRVLSMDSASLRKDLAGLDFNVHLLHSGPQGNVWLSGATSDALNQRPSSANGGKPLPAAGKAAGKENAAIQREREERLRILREKQTEERQRKLEELKQQALAAQKFREQKEEERRRRIEDMRQRDGDRRHQVEERKRQIHEAEQERRTAILRKNQEREARIEMKRKNERSSIVFAFGSSTPRMLEPADTGGSYWATRRATSTTTLFSGAPLTLTRRGSERDLDGSKKRATSASGLDRKPGGGVVPPHALPLDEDCAATSPDGVGSGYMTPRSAMAATAARRKTDLIPTTPSPRDGQGHGPPSTRQSRRTSGLRSGETTPSRPLSAMSQQSMSSVSSSIGAPMRSRPVAAPRRPRPASIAVTGVTIDPPPRHSLSSEHKRQAAAAAAAAASLNGTGDKPPVPRTGSSSRKTSSDRMTASMYGAIPCSDSTSSIPPKKPPKTVKASPRPTPKATPLQSPRTDTAPALPQDPFLNQTKVAEPSPKAATSVAPSPPAETAPAPSPAPAPAHASLPSASPLQLQAKAPEAPLVSVQEPTNGPKDEPAAPAAPAELTFQQMEQKHQEQIWEASRQVEDFSTSVTSAPVSTDNLSSEAVDMTASMIAKQRITTEEEAKAALAERRRLAREQAEREAELERQRLEAERLAEEERLRQEEEDQRRFEEEQERLAVEARRAEEQRLLQAIEEAQKREEEERKRREEEAQQKAEKEEAEKKAKEEAEKQRKEMELKLKKEEEERMERRKRVEAIMLRTRGKGTTPTSTPTKENGDLNQIENEEPQPSETIQEAKSVSPATTSSQSNGHSNGMDSIKQNNAANVLLDLSEHNSVHSGDLLGSLSNEDCINSNLNANNGLINGPAPLIAAFNDSTLSKKQDSNVVTDLLS